MNVGQLLKLLEGLDPNTPVLLAADDGFVADCQFSTITYPGDEYMDDVRYARYASEHASELVDGTYVIINISE